METLEMTIRTEKVGQSRLPEVDFNNIAFGRIFSDHMFVADFVKGQWQDFRIVPYGRISLSPSIMALHYGQSIFEGMKAYKNAQDGQVLTFRPWENIRRMNASATRMCMPEIPEEVFLRGLHELLHLDREWVPALPGCSLYIRPFMFATDEFVGMKPSESYKFVIFTCPVSAYYSEPVKVKVEKYYTRAAEGGTGAAKCAGNYAASLYPARLAQQQGFHQLLWTDGKTHQYIEESGTMNVMFLIGDTLITAPTGDTILPGITRKSVLQIARDWGMRVEERPVTVAEVVAALENGTMKEAFGTGTAATIAHISHISHEGTEYALPDVQSRQFSNKMLQYLSDYQRGNVEDTYGWMYRI